MTRGRVAALLAAAAAVGAGSGVLWLVLDESTPSALRTTTTPSVGVTTTALAPTTAASTTTTVPAPIRYAFPVAPAGAASYGRTHHDYPATDVFAPCGTPYLASTSGVVHELSRVDRWDPSVNDGATRGGLYVSFVGDDGVRYYASHLASVTEGVEVGDRVEVGDQLGAVGDSGNAGGTGCHVHFGLSPPCDTGEWSVRRGVVYPWPYLDSWREGGARSPAPEVEAWHATHPHACGEAVSSTS